MAPPQPGPNVRAALDRERSAGAGRERPWSGPEGGRPQPAGCPPPQPRGKSAGKRRQAASRSPSAGKPRAYCPGGAALRCGQDRRRPRTSPGHPYGRPGVTRGRRTTRNGDVIQSPIPMPCRLFSARPPRRSTCTIRSEKASSLSAGMPRPVSERRRPRPVGRSAWARAATASWLRSSRAAAALQFPGLHLQLQRVLLELLVHGFHLRLLRLQHPVRLPLLLPRLLRACTCSMTSCPCAMTPLRAAFAGDEEVIDTCG